MGTINQYSKMNLSIDENDKGELCIWDEINEKHVQCIATITDNNYDIGQLFKAAPKLLEALQICSKLFDAIAEQMPDSPLVSHIGFQMTRGTVNGAITEATQ